jgi:hypothetical protein
MTANDDATEYSSEILRGSRALVKTRTCADASARPEDDDFWRDARVVIPSREWLTDRPRDD